MSADERRTRVRLRLRLVSCMCELTHPLVRSTVYYVSTQHLSISRIHKTAAGGTREGQQVIVRAHRRNKNNDSDDEYPSGDEVILISLSLSVCVCVCMSLTVCIPKHCFARICVTDDECHTFFDTTILFLSFFSCVCAPMLHTTAYVPTVTFDAPVSYP